MYMCRRGFGAVLLVAAAAVLLLVVGGAVYFLSANKSPSVSSPPLTSVVNQNPSQPSMPLNNSAGKTGTAGQAVMSSPSDTSDQGLQQDMKSLDQQFSSSNTDSANVDNSFSDQPVNLN